MKFDIQSIAHLADLAKMQLSEPEKIAIQKDLTEILDMVDQLNVVSTDHVVPTSHITGILNITRKDEENYTFAKEDMTKTMPEVDEQGYLKVHAVFTEESPSH